MKGHIAAEALHRDGAGIAGLAAAAHDGVDGVDGRGGRERRAGHRLDAVLAVGEGAGLPDELAGKVLLGTALAQAFRLVGRIDGQRLDGVVGVEFDGRRHVPGKALFRGGIGAAGGGALVRLVHAQLVRIDAAGDGIHAVGHRARRDRRGRHAVHILVQRDVRRHSLELIGKRRLAGERAQAGRLIEGFAADAHTGDDAVGIHAREHLHGTAIAVHGGLAHVADGRAVRVQSLIEAVQRIALRLPIALPEFAGRLQHVDARRLLCDLRLLADPPRGQSVGQEQHHHGTQTDCTEHNPRRQFFLHSSHPPCISFSPDGKS